MNKVRKSAGALWIHVDLTLLILIGAGYTIAILAIVSIALILKENIPYFKSGSNREINRRELI